VAQGRRQRQPERVGAGARPARKSAEQVENAKLKPGAERAERVLAKTMAALDVVGKAHALLEMLSESADSEPRSKP
jgi:transposase